MIGEQEFLKYRCLVAMIHVDEVVYSSETEMIEETLKDVNLSDLQRHIIENDMHNPQDLAELYSEMNDEDQKHHLVQLAFKLFWADHSFHTAEQKIFLMLRENF